jgi:hypothetical protein
LGPGRRGNSQQRRRRQRREHHAFESMHCARTSLFVEAVHQISGPRRECCRARSRRARPAPGWQSPCRGRPACRSNFSNGARPRA